MLTIVFAMPGRGRADACLQDGWKTGSGTGLVIFPNWTRVPVTGAQFWLYSGMPGTELIQGITVCNFGTASNSDFKGVYIQLSCSLTGSGLLTLTYAGTYAEDSGSLPAWTWSGIAVDFSGCPDLCGKTPCGGAFDASIIVDVASCPAAGVTVQMGFPVKEFVGSVTDDMGCQAPLADVAGPLHTIQYLHTTGPVTAIPGDTIQFTIYYGRPGSSNMSAIRIIDSIPSYMHYVGGSATPAPDPGWDPEPGPPMRLMWTIPGPIPPGGGPTGMISFSASVDWGNGDVFEPGSGDVAAPEGVRLENRAHGTWELSTCPTAVSNQTETTVRRFQAWMVGDNDLLFSQAPGQSPDEMIYEIFIRNLSSTRTWWDVRIWDTVPAQLDPWCLNCGFDDPCAGWTMTPSGCAAATPGRMVSAGNTIMTWKLDMKPGATLTLRWKAQVRANASPGDTVLNAMGLIAQGRTGVAGGTGNSAKAASFSHLAPIVLPVTYVSYLSFVASSMSNEQPSRTTFFPLNKKAQFELRSLEYRADAFSNSGGVSASIDCLIGDCLGGFPGSPMNCPASPIAQSGTSRAGCKGERVPAYYDIPLMVAYPYQYLYKLTSNSPVCWGNAQQIGAQCSDYHLYAPSSNLSYTGLIHYAWRTGYGSTVGGAQGTSWVFINTGKTPSGAVDTTLDTTVHLFKFNYASLAWDYVSAYDIAGESVATSLGTTDSQEGAYRSVSSNAQLIVWAGYNMMSTLGCGCPCYNDSTLMPTRESGGVVGSAGMTFYGSTCGNCYTPRAAVGNLGATDATYRVSVYVPDSTTGPAALPVNLRGTSGQWLVKGVDVVSAGLLAALNPRIYPNDGTLFDNPGNSVYKVEHLGGGNIQIFHGIKIFTGYGGGAVLHAADGNPTGAEFWVHQTEDSAGTNGYNPTLYSLNVFCPKAGMAIKMETDDGRTETYTTNGPDQCVSFVNFAAPARKRNIRMTRLVAGASGNVLAMYNSANEENPGLTAPFMATGVHYVLVLPPSVIAGQSLWLTVVVTDSTGSTKSDYVGTTSFTSTDPTARINGFSMETYNYTWNGSEGGVKLFPGVILAQLGLQSLMASDVSDGMVAGIAVVNVVGMAAGFSGWPRLTVAASSDTVQFKACWSNYSSASGFTFVITDAVPTGSTYVPEVLVTYLNCGNTDGVPISVGYSTSNSPTAPAAGLWSTGNPIAGTRWLRWSVPLAGVQTTGCVCFRVKVD